MVEDDVLLSNNFRRHFENLQPPPDWQVLYLGCVFRTPPLMVSPGLLRVMGPTWDMHAYMIRPEFARIVSKELGRISTARYVKEGGKETACDVVMAEFHDRYPTYAVWPPMAWQREGYSNNEHCVRCNYCPDGTQRIYRENIEHLLTDEQREFYAKWSEEEKRLQEEKEFRRKNPPRSAVQLRNVKIAGAAAFVPSIIIGVDGKEITEPGGKRAKRPEKPRKQTEAGSPETGEPQTQGIEAIINHRIRRKGLPKVFFRNQPEDRWASRGILVSPYSPDSERMAFALVCSLRRYQRDLPVCVLAQDYLCTLPWGKLAQVKTVRAPAAHQSDEQWFNKLGTLMRSPFEETLFFDCDIVLLQDPMPWFDILATDDFTCFHRLLGVNLMPKETVINVVNVHRMHEEFGIEATPVIDGGGHFFFRNTERGRHLLRETAMIMHGALEVGPPSLYHRMAGPGNCAASDEIAFSIAAVQEKISMPTVQEALKKPISVFLPPHQHHAVFDLPGGYAQFYDEWTQSKVEPGAVHFCHASKNRAEYRSYIQECLREHAVPKVRAKDPTLAAATEHSVRSSPQFSTNEKRKFLFDLGHHYGQGLDYLRKTYQVDDSWTVFSFEPNSRCRQALAKSHQEGVFALPLAAHSSSGPVKFQREAPHPGGPEDGQGSHIKGIGFELESHGGGEESAWAVDFPKFLSSIVGGDRSMSHVVVKMDIEGAEYEILRKMLSDGSLDLVDVLHVEFHDRLMATETPETTQLLKQQLQQRVRLVDHW